MQCNNKCNHKCFHCLKESFSGATVFLSKSLKHIHFVFQNGCKLSIVPSTFDNKSSEICLSVYLCAQWQYISGVRNPKGICKKAEKKIYISKLEKTTFFVKCFSLRFPQLHIYIYIYIYIYV